MRVVFVLVSFLIIIGGCKSKKEIAFREYDDQPETNNIDIVSDESISEMNEETPLITQKEESIYVIDNLSHHSTLLKYHVIMGSFKNVDNAKRFQSQIKAEGFESQLLQNDTGLYRVSAFSYENINEARQKVIYIRKNFKKYNDTWLLIKTN
ncbi:MAG: SPOR domain-containing protein [Bacteroidetes bacterium]|nr:SPOR domain-containing protein [Bacteroidota bacterium]